MRLGVALGTLLRSGQAYFAHGKCISGVELVRKSAGYAQIPAAFRHLIPYFVKRFRHVKKTKKPSPYDEGFFMEPMAGFEPATFALRKHCSTN